VEAAVAVITEATTVVATEVVAIRMAQATSINLAHSAVAVADAALAMVEATSTTTTPDTMRGARRAMVRDDASTVGVQASRQHTNKKPMVNSTIGFLLV
jgi:hypothetical protein